MFSIHSWFLAPSNSDRIWLRSVGLKEGKEEEEEEERDSGIEVKKN